MKPSPRKPAVDTQAYELHFPRLVTMATSELHIPEEEATRLVHDLLIATLFRLNPPGDLESSLNGALRSAAQRRARVGV